MAYDETPKKPIEIRDGRKDGYYSHDECLDKAESAGTYGVRTDAAAEGCDYIGMDDIDRIRKKNLKHKTR
jgi:hypothetical protein